MTTPDTVLAVIRYLGRIALVLTGGAIALTAYVLHLAGKSGSVDPVAVAAVAAITTLLGTVIGALGAILVSTRSGPSEDEPVAVVGPSGGPVETVEVGDVTGDAGSGAATALKPPAPPESTEPSRRRS